MRILRFIAVLFCCLSFASASVASVRMQCGMGDVAVSVAEEAMPCHGGDDGRLPSEQDDAMKMAGCNCVCTLQTVNLPVPELPERAARQAEFAGFVPLPPLESHSPIEAPPKSRS